MILINETLARLSFPGENPVGTLTNRGMVIGIVGDVRQASLDRPSLPELYFPIAQNWSQLAELGLTLIVSTRDPPQGIIEPVRAIVREVEPNQAVFGVKTMEQVMEDSLSDFTAYLTLIGLAAGLALLLATTGTYAVISYMATARTREFAIRVALGADRATVMGLVVRQGLGLTVAGSLRGRPARSPAPDSWQGSRSASVRPISITAGPVAVLVAVVAIAACLAPARRAAGSDPIGALRGD